MGGFQMYVCKCKNKKQKENKLFKNTKKLTFLFVFIFSCNNNNDVNDDDVDNVEMLFKQLLNAVFLDCLNFYSLNDCNNGFVT